MKTGLVIYALDLVPMTTFYQTVFDLNIVNQGETYTALSSGEFELVILQTPDDLLDKYPPTANPPAWRESNTIKPVFYSSLPIDAIRTKTTLLGGNFNQPEQEWQYHHHRVCDGTDIEGNIFQVRQQAA